MTDYRRVIPVRKTGRERFHAGTKELTFDLAGFWQWSVSDLLSNATRGRLAEYLVARAIGIDVDSTVRDEWDACDLRTVEGVRVEVKSAAFLQSWYQKGPSVISFRIPRTRTWDAEDATLSDQPSRQADFYVFALLTHADKTTVDPTDVAQWRFYVLPTSTLNERTRSQHSIALLSLEALTKAVSYSELGGAFAVACAKRSQRDF